MTWDPRPSSATLILDDPVASLQNWNRNPESLERLVDGRRVSAVEHQKLIAEREIQPFLDGPAFDDAMVPDAMEIFITWTETLNRLARFIDGFKAMNFADDREMAETLEHTRREFLSKGAADYRDDPDAQKDLEAGLSAVRDHALDLVQTDARELVERFGQMGRRKLQMAG